MGLVKTVGLVLHPGRDCTPAMHTLLGWARDRSVTVLSLDSERGRVPGPTEPRDIG